MGLQNLGSLLSVHRGSDHPAVVDVSASFREYTYAELDDDCNAVARGLVARGCRQGDTVGLLSLNRVEYLQTLFGAMRVGCIPVPINPTLPIDGVAAIAKDAHLKVIFIDAGSRLRCPAEAQRIDYDDGKSYSSFLQPGPFEAVVPTPTDPSLMLYTSGSTGIAKGVLQNHLGHASMVEQSKRSRAKLPPTITSTPMAALVQAPLYHKAGLRWAKTTLALGGTVVLLPRFDAELAIRAIPKYRISFIAGTPTIFGMMLQERALLDTTDLSSVRMVVTGGAPMSLSVLEGLKKYFPIAQHGQAYGTTETGVPFGRRTDGREAPIESVGVPFPEVEVRLEGEGEDGNPDEGVLFVRGPQVMIGYFNRVEETAAKLKGGWFNTGDVFRRDHEGNFYFVRRVDDMIRCGGEKVYPRDVEQLLERHPDVLMAAVVAMDDDLKGQIPIAFVVCRPDARATEQSLKEFALESGPAFAHPRRIHIEDELPLLPTGKVDKRELQARLTRPRATDDSE